MSISAAKDIRSELEQYGYTISASGRDLRVSDELWQSWLSLTIDYADLPADEHLPGGARYRFRRYGRFRFSPHDGALSRLPHEDYFQSVEINSVTGGFIRKFAPLLETTSDNPVSAGADSLRLCTVSCPRRRSTDRGLGSSRAPDSGNRRRSRAPGLPTPEGIHRDGAAYVTVHLAELVNAWGGEVTIYNDDRQRC